MREEKKKENGRGSSSESKGNVEKGGERKGQGLIFPKEKKTKILN